MLRYAVLGIIGLAASTAWAQQTPPAETPPPASTPAARAAITMEEPKQGDFWTYEMRDEISGKVKEVRTNMVTDVTATEISVRYEIKDSSTDGFNTYDRSWNLKDSAPWKYRPHNGAGIQSPLKVGASWKFVGDDTNPTNGSIWKRTGHAKVVAQETVTTRAGTFETFKIETTINRHPTKDPTRKNDIVQQTWYAPSIDHWAKRIFVSRENNLLRTHNTWELVDYGRKQ